MEDRRTFLGRAAAAALLPLGLDAEAAAQAPAGQAPATPPSDVRSAPLVARRLPRVLDEG